jgi:hypothetical protein
MMITSIMADTMAANNTLAVLMVPSAFCTHDGFKE